MTLGGLGIKKVKLMNVGLGARILWILITGKMSLWKEITLKKYIGGRRKFIFLVESLFELTASKSYSKT